MVLAFLQGPVFRLLAEQAEEIASLKAEKAEWQGRAIRAEARNETHYPAKGRSPAEWRFRVRGWEWIEMTIYPRDQPGGKTIPALRIYVPLEDQPGGPGFWDITRKRAQAMIEPLLPRMLGTDDVLVLRQVGRGYRSFDSLSFYPAKRA